MAHNNLQLTSEQPDSPVIISFLVTSAAVEGSAFWRTTSLVMEGSGSNDDDMLLLMAGAVGG